MEQSHKAAEPTPPLSASKLAQILKARDPAKPLSPGEEQNRLHAAEELSHIFELHGSGAFTWFEAQFIDKPFQTARALLLGEYTKREELETAQPIYVALKKVKAGMLEREIAHRAHLDPEDAELPGLREKLAAL